MNKPEDFTARREKVVREERRYRADSNRYLD